MPSWLRHGTRRYWRLAFLWSTCLLFLLYIFTSTAGPTSVLFGHELNPVASSQIRFSGPFERILYKEDTLDCKEALGNT
jgi:hypothetical protein